VIFASKMHGIQRFHNYLQTKIIHNFHLINQNGMTQSFPPTYKSREPISIFYLKKMIFKEVFWVAHAVCQALKITYQK